MNIEPNYISDNLLFYNADNLTIMKQYPDKHFPLAIVISKDFYIFVSN